MSLTSVKMSEEVWLTCVSHALTTETEEIMGLLLGDTKVCLASPFVMFEFIFFLGDAAICNRFLSFSFLFFYRILHKMFLVESFDFSFSLRSRILNISPNVCMYVFNRSI